MHTSAHSVHADYKNQIQPDGGVITEQEDSLLNLVGPYIKVLLQAAPMVQLVQCGWPMQRRNT